jgi:hypothetical protein
MANKVPDAETDHAENQKPAAESEERAAPKGELGVMAALGGFQFAFAEVLNHSSPSNQEHSRSVLADSVL